MKRRDSIKSILVGAAGGSALIASCKLPEQEQLQEFSLATESYMTSRTPAERKKLEDVMKQEYLTADERNTITALCDLILPEDQYGPAASEVGVVDFIDFIIKDIPRFQLPIRGGLMWFEQYCKTTSVSSFVALTEENKRKVLDTLAYPIAKEQGLGYGHSFFKLIKNLSLTGYYTTREGYKSLGYQGNVPNVWDGIPEEVLADHDVAYDPAWLAKCVDQSKRDIAAEWDDTGKLIS